jgi:hypothetical protein
MTELKRTALRHRVLAELIDPERSVQLDCVNEKQSIWKPRRAGVSSQFGNFTAGESRAVNYLLFHRCARTPGPANMNVSLPVEATDTGRYLLKRWNERFGVQTNEGRGE